MTFNFHKNLIQNIKLNKKDEVYNILEKIINENENENILKLGLKQNHLDLILSFMTADNNDINTFNTIIKLYEKYNWKLDLSSYSLIIKFLCSLNHINEALSYLEKVEKEPEFSIKNRVISPLFEKLERSSACEVFIISNPITTSIFEVICAILFSNKKFSYKYIFPIIYI